MVATVLSERDIKQLKPRDVGGKLKANELRDKKVPGLIVRAQPSERRYYYVAYKRPIKNEKTGKWKNTLTRMSIGRVDHVSLAEARSTAQTVLSAAHLAINSGHKGDRVTSFISQKLLGIDGSVEDIEKAAAAKDACPILEEYIDREYGPEQEREFKYARNGRETKRLKFLLGMFSNEKVTNLLPMKLTQISRRNIKAWRARRMDTIIERTGKPPSIATIARDIACMSGVFSAAVADEYIVINPVRALKTKGKKSRSAKPTQIVRYLGSNDPTEEKRLLDALLEREQIKRDERTSYNRWAQERGYEQRPDIAQDEYADYVRPLVLLALNSGLRRGELLALQWKHLHISGSKNGNHFVRVPGRLTKNGEAHEVPLNPFVLRVLRKWQKQCATLDRNAYVFAGRTGKPITNLRNPWKRLLKMAGITNFRFHDLRHDYASKLVMQGAPLNTVRELLNHADLQMTLRYAHLSDDHKQDAVNTLATDEKKWIV